MTRKLNWESVEDIRRMLQNKVHVVEIAKTYKISTDTIYKIKQGRMWLHPEQGTMTKEEWVIEESDKRAKAFEEMLNRPKTEQEKKMEEWHAQNQATRQKLIEQGKGGLFDPRYAPKTEEERRKKIESLMTKEAKEALGNKTELPPDDAPFDPFDGDQGRFDQP